MSVSEYNLLKEKWIRVMTSDCKVQEVSLIDAIVNSHKYVRLSGEVPAQDIAVLRLMLAVIHTVFFEFDENGERSSLYDIDESDVSKAALKRWSALWELKEFNEKPILNYLTKWEDRFWLFHEERPFWQVPEAGKGTEYASAKLNGEVSESGNKIRLFSNVSGNGKKYLNYSEAARWLIYINAFDDTSGKTKEKGLPSPGAGWLGKLGLVYIKGKNLFETLMLNFVMLEDGIRFWQEKNMPVWERESARSQERCEIPIPKNQAELLTLQSRRLLLIREEDKVVGFKLLGGDFFQKSDAFQEQMTVWKHMKDKSGKIDEYQPKRHDPSRQLWRDFSTLFVENEDSRQPGVIKWYTKIAQYMKWPKNSLAEFQIVSVHYGDKDFFVDDSYNDNISFSIGIIYEVKRIWQRKIVEEIDRCDKIAAEVERLCSSIIKATGGNAKNNGRSLFYSKVDIPFRKWLKSIDASADDTKFKEKVEQWHEELKYIARDLGKQIINSAGEAAFKGRMVTEKIKEKEERKYYCSADAYNYFQIRLYKIFNS